MAVPILDQQVRDRLEHMFEMMMSDDEKGKEQNAKGEYCDREVNADKLNSQEFFYQEAYDLENSR